MKSLITFVVVALCIAGGLAVFGASIVATVVVFGALGYPVHDPVLGRVVMIVPMILWIALIIALMSRD